MSNGWRHLGRTYAWQCVRPKKQFREGGGRRENKLGSLFADTGPVFQPAGGRTAGLRRGREVFEGEEPFQIIAHADQGPLQ